MEFVYILFGGVDEVLPQVRRSFSAAERTEFKPYCIGRRSQIFLPMCPAQDHQAHTFWQLLSDQVTHERARFANFLCRHLGIVSSVDDDAEKRLRVLGSKRGDALR